MIVFRCVVLSCFFFFFKQKTAYEMRISDWSSDVCSSDLRAQMEGFKAEIEGYTARVDANKSQFQAYGELVKAEGVKGDIYKAVADAFASRVRAYGSNVDAVLATVKAQTDIEGLKVQGRSGERRVGKEGVSTGRSRWSPYT